MNFEISTGASEAVSMSRSKRLSSNLNTSLISGYIPEYRAQSAFKCLRTLLSSPWKQEYICTHSYNSGVLKTRKWCYLQYVSLKKAVVLNRRVYSVMKLISQKVTTKILSVFFHICLFSHY